MELSNLLIKLIGFWYGLASIFLFALYGLDKKQSIIGGRRIPEKTLHLTALAGGFFGGLMGRGIFHHKTRKPVFMIILLSSAILHGILWFILLR
jgi:uncharacterized membrane protein YsdA (DUF1294 family)